MKEVKVVYTVVPVGEENPQAKDWICIDQLELLLARHPVICPTEEYLKGVQAMRRKLYECIEKCQRVRIETRYE